MQRRRVKIVRPESLDPDETWARINGFAALLSEGMSEAQFQEHCEYVLRAYGWTVFHNGDSRRADAGLPDLIALSPDLPDGSVVLAMLELKTAKGRLRQEQEVWLTKLSKATTLVTGVLRPDDWTRLVQLGFDPAGATEEGVRDRAGGT